jgi:heterogeneous nuclear ribonucleoprotein F/H
MTMSREGRPSGEAYIEMEGLDDIEIGLKKDKEHMGHRYIEGIDICFAF